MRITCWYNKNPKIENLIKQKVLYTTTHQKALRGVLAMKKTICIVLTMLLLSSSSLIGQETPAILFDEYHATWKPSILTDVLSELEMNGYSASFSKERISSSLLSGHDILVLMIPYRGFSDDEKEAIQDFVKNGGGLIIFGEHGPYMDYKGITNPVNSISTLFGIEFNSDAVSDPENRIDEDGWIFMITNFKSHPVTKGVETIVYVSGCSLKVKSPATGLAFGSPTAVADGQEGRDIVVLAAAEYGKGKVLAIGDTDFLGGPNTPGYEDSDYLSIGDTMKFVVNMFEWVTPSRINIEEAATSASQGYTLFSQRNYSQAKLQFENALEIYSDAGDSEKVSEIREMVAKCNKALDATTAYEEGVTSYEQGAYESAQTKFEESKSLYDEIGDSTGSAEAQSMIDKCTEALDTTEGVQPEEPEESKAAKEPEEPGGEEGTPINWLIIIGIAAGGIVVVVLVVKVFLRKPEPEKPVLPEPEKIEKPAVADAFQVLGDRYAKGEITREEYERIKSKLGKTEVKEAEEKEEITEKVEVKKIICPFCKNEIEEGWVSCPHCGTRLGDDTKIY